jgi:predicted dehydrogenase
MNGGSINIIVVGLGFGSHFVPIYQRHPDVGRVALCDLDADKLKAAGETFGIEDLFLSFEEAIKDDRFNAVHLLSPVPLHVEQTLAVLASGKHCACAVPMATELIDLQRIVDVQNSTGLNYMMMETGVYDRAFLFARELCLCGELGRLTYLQGSYFQDLEGAYPAYWRAQPPMHYATHVMGPILSLAGTVAESVCCFGAGKLRPDIQMEAGNVFPLQVGLFRLAGLDAVAEVTRSWFQVARSYTEAFSVYGDRKSFEWQQLEHESPVMYTLNPLEPARRGRQVTAERVEPPYRPDLLPAEIAEFADGYHGGSHPHLAHEFVRSIVEKRPSAINAETAANWCAPGICANDSALRGGASVPIPRF